MRELKYRQRVDNRWHYWGYIDGCFIGPVTNQQPNPINCEYTGLKDKNDVEIYEGDLIKATSRENRNDSMAIFKVAYDSVYGSFVGHVAKKIFPVLSPSNWPLGELRFDAQVIGNIYENPELLE